MSVKSENLPVFAVVPPIAGGLAKYVLNPVPETVDEADKVVNAPALATVEPMAGGEARYVEKPVPDTVLEADNVVNAPVLGVVFPIAGGLDKSNAPPKVKFPDDVTVPDKVMPDTVPVPLTEVTVPPVDAVGCHDAVVPFEVST